MTRSDLSKALVVNHHILCLGHTGLGLVRKGYQEEVNLEHGPLCLFFRRCSNHWFPHGLAESLLLNKGNAFEVYSSHSQGL